MSVLFDETFYEKDLIASFQSFVILNNEFPHIVTRAASSKVLVEKKSEDKRLTGIEQLDKVIEFSHRKF